MNSNWKKNISLFLLGQFISLFGSMLVQYAIIWHITLSTESGIMLTISILCGFIPGFLIAPFAGVWADRFNKKHLIIIADALIAVSTLILAIIMLSGYNELYLLFIISGIRSLGSGIQSPSIQSYLPILVPTEKLTRINSINSSFQSLIVLFSPILSGVLLGVAQIGHIFFIDVITAAIAILILVLLVKDNYVKKVRENSKLEYFTDLKLGLNYIRKNKFLKTYFIFCAIFLIFVAPVSFLTQLQITRNYGESVRNLTLLEVTFSGGMMLGSIIVGAWGGFKNRMISMTISNVFIAIAVISLGIVDYLWVYLAFMALIGLVLPLFNIPATVLLQETIDFEYMGRVFSIYGMIASIMMPIGMLVFGPLADQISIETILIISGTVLLVISICMMLNKTMIKAGIPTKKEEVKTNEGVL